MNMEPNTKNVEDHAVRGSLFGILCRGASWSPQNPGKEPEGRISALIARTVHSTETLDCRSRPRLRRHMCDVDNGPFPHMMGVQIPPVQFFLEEGVATQALVCCQKMHLFNFHHKICGAKTQTAQKTSANGEGFWLPRNHRQWSSWASTLCS